MGTGAIVAIALGTILVLGGIGYGIYALLGGSKSGPPAGWSEYAYRDDGFKAYFPKQPQVDRMGGIPGGFDGGGAGGFPGFGGGGGGGTGSMTVYGSGDFNDSVHINVAVFQFPSGIPSALRNQMTQGFESMPGVPKAFGIETKSVRWMGVKATEIAHPGGVMRIAVTDKAMYQATISGKNGGRATRAEEDGFFDNFVPAR